MHEKENNFYSLESIIKVEPEEFQRVTEEDVLRSKAKIFSDPIVILERLNIGATTFGTSKLDRFKKKRGQSVIEGDLARKGNDGLHSMDPHTCCFCQKVCSNRGNLRKHIQCDHLKTKKLSCDLCPKFYFSKFEIAQHMKLVHSKKRFTCNVCDYKTADKSYLEKHKLTHGAKVACPVCNKQVSSLKRHMTTHRPKVSCPICQKMMNKDLMTQHMKTHGKKCKSCDKVFESHEELRRHNFKMHYDGELHECHCGSVYNRRGALKVHQQSHNGRIACEVCQKQYSTMAHLKRHWRKMHLQTHGVYDENNRTVRVLNRNGPFICDKCGSKHPTRVSFQNHNNRKHRSATMFCDLCSRSFNLKCFLINHMKRVHLKLRAFECKVCGHKSFSKRSLKIHLLLHGSRIKCKVCHKLVTNMSVHMRTHVEMKCPTCNKIFSKTYLTRHIKTHDKFRELSNASRFLCKFGDF